MFLWLGRGSTNYHFIWLLSSLKKKLSFFKSFNWIKIAFILHVGSDTRVIYKLRESVLAGVRQLSSQSQLLSLSFEHKIRRTLAVFKRTQASL